MTKTLILTVVRNEGPYLLEWIAHHAVLGFEPPLVYSHDCDDRSAALLDQLNDAGVVHHRPFAPENGRSYQFQAYALAARDPFYRAADWVMVADLDEYLNLAPPLETVSDLIAAAGGADAIAMPWRLFGSAGLRDPGEGLTVQRFTRAAPDACAYPVAASFIKSLYRRKGPFGRPGIHRPRGQNGTPAWVDGALRPLPPAFAGDSSRIQLYGLAGAGDQARINHYSLRSLTEFLVKRDRGLPNRRNRAIDLAYWVERNLNTVADESILRHLPATNDVLARLRGLPGVAEAELRCRHWHADRAKDLLRDPEVATLAGRIVLAGDSQVPDAETADWLVSAYVAAQRKDGDAA